MSLLAHLWSDEQGQDIAEYAVMLARVLQAAEFDDFNAARPSRKNLIDLLPHLLTARRLEISHGALHI